MPIQSDYEAISGAGSDIATGLTKGLMYQKQEEEKQKALQSDKDYKTLGIAMAFMEKGMNSKDTVIRQQMAQIFNHTVDSGAWNRAMGFKPEKISEVGDKEIKQMIDFDELGKTGNISGLIKNGMPPDEAIKLAESAYKVRIEKDKFTKEQESKNKELGKNTTEYNGEVYQFNPDTNGYDIYLGKGKSKEYTPELKKFTNSEGKIMDVNMNIPKEVADARARGFTEFEKPISSEAGAKLAHQLRTELKDNPYVKDFQDIDTKFGVMNKAYELSKTTKNFVAVDQTLITLFNKMTDPNSVVRESEYVRTPQNLSLVNRFRGAIQKYGAGGAGISQADRVALIDMANEFHNSYSTNYDETINNYKSLAKETGISEALIGIPYNRKNIAKKDTLGIR